MIEVENLTKYYGPTRSIEDVSFSVGHGEVLGFVGPNGAGKSTTMRIIVGLVRSTAGTVRVGGFDVQNQNEKIRPLIGYLPEQAPVYGDMTLQGYLSFMAGLRGLHGREAKREVERTTAIVNLQKERGRLIRNLSKGTRQRAAIAQALLGDPKVLILDEPTVGLDPSQINDVRALIRSMQGTRTVILSTHILHEVELTCSRIAIIADGRIVSKGTPQELIGEGESTFHIVVRGDLQAFENILKPYFHEKNLSIEEREGMLHAEMSHAPSKQKRAALARRIVEANLELIEFRPGRLRLEDVFLRSTGRTRAK
jgi:ABC-2 type transport system ATP-binding protein